MNLHGLSAQDTLIEGAIEEYQRGMDFFFYELVNLNVDIIVVEQILNFPFSLFVGPEKKIFFSRVVDNFLNAAILTITKIATDNGADLYTLRGFRNRVLQLIRAEYQDEFRSMLKQSRFDQTTEKMLQRARNLRNDRIAHATKAQAFRIREQDRVDFREIIHLKDILNNQLDVLSFNTEHMMLPVEYDPGVQHPRGVIHKTDIEDLLDSVAHNSYLLRMPEEKPEMWTIQRTRLSEMQINQVNHYRRKFGLTDV